MAISKEYERKREEIAHRLADWDGWDLDELPATEYLATSYEPSQETYYGITDQILKLVRIEAEEGQLSMPKPDSEGKVWVRCLWKEEK